MEVRQPAYLGTGLPLNDCSYSQAYVGGLYEDQGLDVVKRWLHPLLTPYIHEAYRIIRREHGLDPEPPQPTPPEENQQYSLVQPGPSSSYPAAARANFTVGHLSFFNQILQQQSKSIQWDFSDSLGEGTKSTTIWVVKAIVGGECLGSGRGSTKKAAKNEAAKQGLVHLGIACVDCEARSQIFHTDFTVKTAGLAPLGPTHSPQTGARCDWLRLVHTAQV